MGGGGKKKKSLRHERINGCIEEGAGEDGRGEASLLGLMTLRRPDESTPAECY